MLKRLKDINWKNVLYSLVWIVCLSGLFVLMGFISNKSSELACNGLDIIIPGTQAFVADEDVEKIIEDREGEVVGRTLNSIQIHGIEEDIKAIPFVEDVRVFYDMDGKMLVKIFPREAVLRVINGVGSDFYIDKTGYKMPVAMGYAPRVIAANGYIAERYNDRLDTIQSTLVDDLYKTANFINADSLWEVQIEQLYVNDELDIELVPRVGNQRIVLGNADSLELKFEKLRLFYDSIVTKAGWDYYQMVNLKYANQIVCQRNDELIARETNYNRINTQ